MDGRSRRRRRVRQRGRGGHAEVDRLHATGNSKLSGVLLAYAADGMARMLKKGMGWNSVSDQLGQRITREIVELVLRKRVKPVIGKVVEFDEIPAAIEAMALRETVGRTIVRLY